MVVSVMAIELQEQLLAQEGELDSREVTLIAWEDGLVVFECALGRVFMECDTECERAKAVWQDYRARIRSSTADCRCSFDFD
jgi:hypothetical protein